MIQKHFSQYEYKFQRQLLNIFHAVENRRFANQIGPKFYSQYQCFVLLVLYKRSKLPLRQFVDSLYESKWPKWLGLSEIPTKSTLHRWLQNFSVAHLRRFLLQTKPKTKLTAIDATGIDSWQRSRHYERRIGEAQMSYAKLDIIVDTESLFVIDHVLHMKPRHDIIAAKSMLCRTKLKGKMLADKGYDSEPLHKLAHSKGIDFFAPVRKSNRKRPRGFFRKKCVHQDEQYSRRNTVESAIHATKCQIPNLRSKLHYMKKREMALALLVYNIERIVRGFSDILLELLWQLSLKSEN